mmetsp:Transcript_19884/g.43028  ORF Transcript_19884/g.43028 Transcript_19884/m.43028 type:complete len:237 (+) Transcript_19884:82-792(+)
MFACATSQPQQSPGRYFSSTPTMRGGIPPTIASADVAARRASAATWAAPCAADVPAECARLASRWWAARAEGVVMVSSSSSSSVSPYVHDPDDSSTNVSPSICRRSSMPRESTVPGACTATGRGNWSGTMLGCDGPGWPRNCATPLAFSAFSGCDSEVLCPGGWCPSCNSPGCDDRAACCDIGGSGSGDEMCCGDGSCSSGCALGGNCGARGSDGVYAIGTLSLAEVGEGWTARRR